MATYQINIYRKVHNAPVDMDAVRTALADILSEDQYSGRGELLTEAINVAPGDVGEAVRLLNALGYQTDEDA